MRKTGFDLAELFWTIWKSVSEPIFETFALTRIVPHLEI